MKKILENLAMIHLIEFTKLHNIKISKAKTGSHLAKNGRGFKWSLVWDDNGQEIITVSFHKSSVPTFSINPNNQ